MFIVFFPKMKDKKSKPLYHQGHQVHQERQNKDMGFTIILNIFVFRLLGTPWW
jgi:hypothetical protein